MQQLQNKHRQLLALATALMGIAFFVPFWKIEMWAPQYPEWLHMKIWLHQITGDVDIINGLNHYIGMKHIKAEMFPEFAIMPFVLGGLMVVGALAAWIGHRWMAWAFLVLLLAAGTAGLVDFYLWGYDYGHNLDPAAAIKVPGMVYQPPLIGTKELLNFIAYSAPDWGAIALGISGSLVILTLVLHHRQPLQIKKDV
jgi:copper chaperone NosL